jgi:pSer/pThr/pTyr-binding forkhead associated (FHA) protein
VAAERVFIIFEGPDKGFSFTVGAKPVGLGREEGRDVVLHDDRASRLHARLLPEADGISVTDNNSSNGTFVNGALVKTARLQEGDIITIGNNRIVFGAEAPSAQEEERRRPKRPGDARQGITTEFLIEMPSVEVQRAEVRLGGFMKSLAEAASELAETRGLTVSIEAEMDPDEVQIDANKLYGGLAAALCEMLKLLPTVEELNCGTRNIGILALRYGYDMPRQGFQIEAICIGPAIPAARILPHLHEKPFMDAREVARAHTGTAEFLPRDSTETLLRIRLPYGPEMSTSPTLIRP